jgi:phage terminase large subunit
MLYQKEMSNQEIGIFLKNNCEAGATIIGDSAEPKSIAEIQRYGVNIFGCKKGKDSIQYGIQLLQDTEILVTKDSLNLIKEFRGYLWAKTKEGTNGPKPISHAPDHLIDALRYIAMDKLGYIENESYSIY